jgi:hypothetical protein
MAISKRQLSAFEEIDGELLSPLYDGTPAPFVPTVTPTAPTVSPVAPTVTAAAPASIPSYSVDETGAFVYDTPQPAAAVYNPNYTVTESGEVIYDTQTPAATVDPNAAFDAELARLAKENQDKIDADNAAALEALRLSDAAFAAEQKRLADIAAQKLADDQARSLA